MCLHHTCTGHPRQLLLVPVACPCRGLISGVHNTTRPGNQVVYLDTFLDLGLLAPVLDEVMAAAGIPPMPPRAGAQP